MHIKRIEIPFVETIEKDAAFREVGSVLDARPFTAIDIEPWAACQYKPEARFSMVHNGDGIFLKFKVRERFVRASHRTNNSPVSQDSCVEFFFSPEGGDHYYNFEFNCVGTCKAAFGTGVRKQRTVLPDAAIDAIRREALISAGDAGGMIAWELVIAIPAAVFLFNRGLSFQGLKGTANFYKCGDHLPDPHFLVWNEVKAQAPDFHTPQHFGNIHFL